MKFLRKIQRVGVLGLALAVTSAGFAQGPADKSVIRIWGHGHRGQDYILTLLKAWQHGFRKSHPNARFEDDLYGDASAIGALYTGTGELAILDRQASFIEVDAYQQGTGYDPFRIPVAQGSVALSHHAPALKVYVNRDNPLEKLTVEQLDGIFDADHRLGKRAYKTWGDLGLAGEWAGRPIQMYAPKIQSAEMQFFERAAMKGSQKFSCCLTLLESMPHASAGSQVATFVANDRNGIGISSETSAAVKAVALETNDGGNAVRATAQSIAAGTYPLARTVYVYVNRKPNTAVTQELKAFLEYIVSPEGQAIVAKTGGYLPLSAIDVRKAREALQ